MNDTTYDVTVVGAQLAGDKGTYSHSCFLRKY